MSKIKEYWEKTKNVRQSMPEIMPAFSKDFLELKEGETYIDKINKKLLGYQEVKYVYKKREFFAEYQVRFDAARNCIQVILQETNEKSDWIVNFNFPKNIYDKFTYDGEVIQLKAHGGWSRMWFAIQDAVREKIKVLLTQYPNCFIEVFGWSLGSGIASLAAEDIYFKFGVKPYLYTFGSVRPFFGKKTLKKAL